MALWKCLTQLIAKIENSAFFINSTQDLGGRGKVRSIRTPKSIAGGAIHEAKNRYDKAAAGRSPVEIVKEAENSKKAKLR